MKILIQVYGNNYSRSSSHFLLDTLFEASPALLPEKYKGISFDLLKSIFGTVDAIVVLTSEIIRQDTSSQILAPAVTLEAPVDAVLHHGDKLLVAQKAVPVVVEYLENWKSFSDLFTKINKRTPKIANANGHGYLYVSYGD